MYYMYACMVPWEGGALPGNKPSKAGSVSNEVKVWGRIETKNPYKGGVLKYVLYFKCHKKY